MTAVPVALDALKATRRTLLETLPKALSSQHRQFLLSLVKAEPDWELLPFAHVQHLPALQWKLRNLEKLRRNATKFAFQHDVLAERLGA